MVDVNQTICGVRASSARAALPRPAVPKGRQVCICQQQLYHRCHTQASLLCGTMCNHRKPPKLRNCCRPRTTAEENKLPTDTTLGENDCAIVTPGEVLARAVQVVIGLVSCPSRWTASPPSYLRAYLTYIHTYDGVKGDYMREGS